MSKKTKKLIIITVIILAIVLCLFIFFPELLIIAYSALKRLVQVISIVFIERPLEWLLILSIFAAIILLVFFVIPLLKFLLGYVYISFSLSILCFKKKLTLKNSFLFSKNRYVQIISSDKQYHLHFINVISNNRIIYFDKENYCVARTYPSKLDAYGATLVDGKSWFDKSAKIASKSSIKASRTKSFPQFEESDSIKHIIIVHSKPYAVYIVNSSKKAEEAYNGSVIKNNVYYYSFKGFIKLLNNK